MLALSAYGALLIANGVLYNYLKKLSKKMDFLGVIFGSLFLWGIAALVGLVGNIILNSQFPQISRLQFPITLALIFPIALMHFEILASALPSNKRYVKLEMVSSGIIGGLWALMIFEFMITLNHWWLLIHPIILFFILFIRKGVGRK